MDVTDTAWLFIQGLNAKVDKTEKWGSQNSLRGTTEGESIFKEVEKTQIVYNPKWNLLRCYNWW